MKNQRPQSPKINTHHYKYGVSFAWAFTGTLLVASSVAQASDMQIYAVPTAGKKTIVMMLDTSGSMGNSDTGQTGSRLTRLKNGMNTFLDSADTSLPNVRVALGHYSLGSKRGKILVPAAPLGAVGSAHRTALKNAVTGLSASGSTPTAAAYAESAAYLMGTTTYAPLTITLGTNVPVYFQRSNTAGTWYYCEEFNSSNTGCRNWKVVSPAPSAAETGTNTESCTQNIDGDDRSGTCYRKSGLTTLNYPNIYSGFNDSVASSKSGSNYISPLPAAADRVSCDGQGVYVLSDGEANGMDTSSSAPSVMQPALGSFGSGFSCPGSGGLNSARSASWHCMGEFAKKMFDRTTNPAGVSIQTAFVGFGGDFNAMTETHVQQACKLSSRTQADRNGNDTCSPGQPTTHALTSPGYGNGNHRCNFCTFRCLEPIRFSALWLFTCFRTRPARR